MEDFTPYRNVPKHRVATGGNPARPSNASLLRYTPEIERYAAGFPMDKIAEAIREALLHAECQQLEKDADYSARLDAMAQRKGLTREEMDQRLDPLVAQVLEHGMDAFAKVGGAEREPEVDTHGSAPAQSLRPRAETVLYNKTGVYCIDKKDYILFPGGGIDDGEQPRDAALRETLEEANVQPVNVDSHGVTEAIWPTNSDNDFWNDSDFDGERSYFFLALDGGNAGITHSDQETFAVVPFDTVLTRLDELIKDPDQGWAKRNNQVRRDLVRTAKRLASTKAGLQRRKQAQVSPTEQLGIGGSPNDTFVEGLAQKVQQQPPKVAPQAPLQEGVPAEPAPMDTPKTAQELVDFSEEEDTTYRPKTMAQLNQNIQSGVHGAAQATDVIGFAQRDVSEQVEKIATLVYSRFLKQALTPEQELEVGSQEELEHTSDPEEASEIAQDHLDEDPDYYDKLREAGLLDVDPDVVTKTADVAEFMPRSQYLQFTPEGKIVLRRLPNRRFALPEQGLGKAAPYEDPVNFIPEGGIPEQGYHGYRIGLNIGETQEVPEGFEAVDPVEALKSFYGSMGLAVNKPYRQLDRARVRAIMRYFKKRRRDAVQA